MKLRLNATLRAALIAAVTAVGLTLAQAQAGSATAALTPTTTDNKLAGFGAFEFTVGESSPYQPTAGTLIYSTANPITLNSIDISVYATWYTNRHSDTGFGGAIYKYDATSSNYVLVSKTGWWKGSSAQYNGTVTLTPVGEQPLVLEQDVVYAVAFYAGESYFTNNLTIGSTTTSFSGADEWKGTTVPTDTQTLAAVGIKGASNNQGITMYQPGTSGPTTNYSPNVVLNITYTAPDVKDYIWNGTSGSHAWSDSVWNTGAQTNVPFVNGGNAAFTATGNATVDITTSVIAHNVTVGGKDYTFVIQSGGSLAADTVELAADGNLTIENKSGSSQAVGAVSGAGNMILTAGTFSIGDFASSGKLVVSDNGTLELGNTRHNIGTLEIGDGGVVTTTRNDGAGCVSGNIDITAGGVFKVAGGHDAFGYNTPTPSITLTGSAEKMAELKLEQTTANSVTMKTNLKLMGHALVSTTKNGFNTFGCSIYAEGEDNTIQKMQLRNPATIEVAVSGELCVDEMIYGQDGEHNLTKKGNGTLTFTGTANMKTLNLTEGTVVLNGTSSVENGLTVASGATLSSQTGTTTAAISFADGACLDVGNNGLVLAGTSSLTLAGKINFSTSSTTGYGEVIVVSGLSKESITGITFDGEDIAVASNYLVLQPELASYSKLQFKDNSLVLLREENGSYWGKDKGDGNWDLTSTNWAPADDQDAVRIFVEDAPAHFTANGGGGTITIAQNVKAESVNVSGEKEYIFNAGGGTLTVVNSVNVGENAKATFYIPLNGTELTLNIKEDGTLNIGADSSVKTVTDKGTLTVSGGKKLATTGAVTLGNNAVLGGTGTIEAGSVVLATGGEENHAELKDGATLKTNSISGTGVLHVLGSKVETTPGDASFTNVEFEGASTLTIAAESTLTVLDKLTIEDTSKVVNKGTFASATEGSVLIQSAGVQLGHLDMKGALHVQPNYSVSATDGAIDALMLEQGASLNTTGDLALNWLTMSNMEGSASLNVGGNLDLTQTASGYTKGAVTVKGNTAITGAVNLTSLSTGALDLTDTGSLTTTGAVDVNNGAITLGRLSMDEVYLKAGSLTSTTTQFELTLAELEALGLTAGQKLTLADVDAAHGAAGNLRINGEVTIQDSRDIIYTISQDTSTWDIILTADNAPSDYIWTNGNETELWSDNLNWSGELVPDSEAWAQVQQHPMGETYTIRMNVDGEAKRFTVAPNGSAKLTDVNDLTIHQSLEVNATGILYIAGSVAVKAPLVQNAGLLFVTESGSLEASQVDVTETMKTLDNAYVKADTLNVTEGIFIASGGEVESGALNLTVSCLMVNEPAYMHTNTLNGDADSTIQGPGVLNVDGKGGRYLGGYDQARIHVSANGDQTLAAREGLSAEGSGIVRLQYVAPASIDRVSGNGMTLVLNSPSTDCTGAPLTLTKPSAVNNGQVIVGLSAASSAITLNTAAAPIIIQATSLDLGGSTVIVNQTETDVQKLPISTSGQTEGLVLAYLGAEDSFAAVTLNGNLFHRYYINPRLEAGRILVDLNTTHVLDQIEATTYNGRAGAHMLDDAFRQLDPQMAMPTGDLAAVMNALEEGRIPRADTDRMAAAMAGASYAAMGSAFSKDVERQLRSIRNRTTSMGCAECVVNEDMPYVNAWVNAEGEFRKMNRENTLAGYTLNSWGATLGVDVDFTPRFTAGVAFTYLQGDFTSRSADMGDGDLDRMYVSAFARYARRAWTHTFVGTFGSADASLDRTVDYGAGRYSTKGDTDGTAFGLMYEAGYTVALSEDASTCLQPVFNVLYRHSSLGGYTETGSDAALKYADAEADVVTFGLGARLQSAVGTSAFNRHTLLETRALLKLDAGDRDVTPQANFVGVGGMQKIKSSEYGAFGVEVGAGLMIPVGEGASSLFFDVSAEFRSGYSDVNGAAGYRVNF